jgi:hypothetical protein
VRELEPVRRPKDAALTVVGGMRAPTSPPNRMQGRQPADARCPVDRLSAGQRGLALGQPRVVYAFGDVRLAASLISGSPLMPLASPRKFVHLGRRRRVVATPFAKIRTEYVTVAVLRRRVALPSQGLAAVLATALLRLALAH